jgi:hypothetical protein
MARKQEAIAMTEIERPRHSRTKKCSATALFINSGPITAEDSAHHVPSGKWRELVDARRRFLKINLSHDCRCLVQFVSDAEIMFSALGYPTRDDLIRSGYMLVPAEIDVAVKWLELNPPTTPISLQVVQFLAKHGGDRRSEKAKADQDSDTTLILGRGRAYILARLNRDRPDLAAKVIAGEMSANAAAIEAGFRKRRRCPHCGGEL